LHVLFIWPGTRSKGAALLDQQLEKANLPQTNFIPHANPVPAVSSFSPQKQYYHGSLYVMLQLRPLLFILL
jgi:hypothetical protein